MLGGLGIIMIDVWGVKTWYGRLGLCLGFGVIASGLVVFISLALLGPIGAMPPIMMLVLYSQPTATIVFALIYLLLHRQNRPDILLTQDNRPALLSRLTLGQEATTVECITAQDHYVNVQTDAGSELCLIRFRDAIAETYPVEGIQIHRSHWIAWHARLSALKHTMAGSTPSFRTAQPFRSVVRMSRRSGLICTATLSIWAGRPHKKANALLRA